MTDSEKQEIDAASEYCKAFSTRTINYDEIYNAFLAGVAWQKQRPEIKPEREYYGG
jgi:hypothetical protein